MLFNGQSKSVRISEEICGIREKEDSRRFTQKRAGIFADEEEGESSAIQCTVLICADQRKNLRESARK
jgi:hypothetical protein